MFDHPSALYCRNWKQNEMRNIHIFMYHLSSIYIYLSMKDNESFNNGPSNVCWWAVRYKSIVCVIAVSNVVYVRLANQTYLLKIQQQLYCMIRKHCNPFAEQISLMIMIINICVGGLMIYFLSHEFGFASSWLRCISWLIPRRCKFDTRII